MSDNDKARAVIEAWDGRVDRLRQAATCAYNDLRDGACGYGNYGRSWPHNGPEEDPENNFYETLKALREALDAFNEQEAETPQTRKDEDSAHSSTD